VRLRKEERLFDAFPFRIRKTFLRLAAKPSTDLPTQSKKPFLVKLNHHLCNYLVSTLSAEEFDFSFEKGK
jgi:hypothetical protein